MCVCVCVCVCVVCVCVGRGVLWCVEGCCAVCVEGAVGVGVMCVWRGAVVWV